MSTTSTRTSSQPPPENIQPQPPKRLSPAFSPDRSPSLTYFSKKLQPYKSTIIKLPILIFFLESIIAAALYSKRYDPILRFQFQQLLSINFFLAGLAHFVPDIVKKYRKLVPDFLPNKDFWVYITGVPMIVGAVLLTFDTTRRVAAQMLLATLIVVFPGNLWCLVSREAREAMGADLTQAVLRLPIQAAMAVWVMWFLD